MLRIQTPSSLQSSYHGEMLIRDFPGFLKPFLSLPGCAGNDDSEVPPVKVVNTAKTENTVLPYCFQRVAEHCLFPFLRCIRCGEYDCCLCLQQPAWHSFTAISFRKFISHPRAKNSVNPPFQYSGRLTPPIGMYNDDTFRRNNLSTVPGYY